MPPGGSDGAGGRPGNDAREGTAFVASSNAPLKPTLDI